MRATLSAACRPPSCAALAAHRRRHGGWIARLRGCGGATSEVQAGAGACGRPCSGGVVCGSGPSQDEQRSTCIACREVVGRTSGGIGDVIAIAQLVRGTSAVCPKHFELSYLDRKSHGVETPQHATAPLSGSCSRGLAFLGGASCGHALRCYRWQKPRCDEAARSCVQEGGRFADLGRQRRLALRLCVTVSL